MSLTQAFRKLRKIGYTAKRNFWCCSSCAWSSLSEADGKKVVFLHKQDEADWRKNGKAYVAWAGDGAEIFDVFKSCGLIPVWDGDIHTRILIHISAEAQKEKNDALDE